MSGWRLIRSGVLWSGLWRKPARTLLTAASLAMAFMLLGLLGPILLLFQGAAQNAADGERLVVQPRHSITDFLPERHAAAVARVPGVSATAHLTWFGGIFRDPANAFPRWATQPSALLALMPSMVLSPEARRAFLNTRTGAIVGRRTASRFGLKPGDLITLVPDIWPNKNGLAWTFEVTGVFDSTDPNVDLTAMYFHYDYFDSYRAWGKGQISYVIAGLASGTNARAAAADVARRIDARFADTVDETVTSTERAYALSFANRLGNVGLMLSVVLGAALFSIAIVCAQTISQSVRERTSEWGVLRALGFRRVHVALVVLAEALALTMLGAIPGLLGAQMLLLAGRDALGSLAVSLLTPRTLTAAVTVVLLLALFAGLLPALRVQRLRIVDALRSA